MILGTRRAIADALADAYTGSTNTANFQEYGCPIDRSSGNQARIMAIQVQYAKIRAAISGQRDPVKNWLLFCFGPDVEALHKAEKQAQIARVVTAEAFKGPHSLKKQGRLQRIAYVAVLDYRIGELMGRELPPSSYTEYTDIPPANWARDWEKYKRDALMVIKGYNSEGIGNVSLTVKAIREAEQAS